MMNAKAILTPREKEIAELFAWGASKKEVANHLFISERTVENHARNIYEKTGCCKVNELSAWWFCHRFCIPFSLSPITRRTLATVLLIFYVSLVYKNVDHLRVRTSTTRITSRVSRGRRKESNYQYVA
jgi:DNA-binding CsgD family transcriptional regulator